MPNDQRPSKPAAALFRYYIPSSQGEGWADVVVGSDGFFAAVSDYGNYAFRWTHFGDRDFRDWFLGIGADYLASKIGGRDVVDEERTTEMFKRRIVEKRRRGEIDSFAAREAWDELPGLRSEADFVMWVERHGVWPDDGLHYCYPSDVRAFVDRALPRIKEAIRAELTDASTTRVDGAAR